MFSHVTIGTNKIDETAVFYEAVLTPLGLKKSPVTDSDLIVGWCWYLAAGLPCFYIVEPLDGNAATVGNGSMVAFTASSSKLVDLVYRAGLEAGGQSEGEPGPRAHYGPGYYGAYLRDPDGNKIHIVCRAETQTS